MLSMIICMTFGYNDEVVLVVLVLAKLGYVVIFHKFINLFHLLLQVFVCPELDFFTGVLTSTNGGVFCAFI